MRRLLALFLLLMFPAMAMMEPALLRLDMERMPLERMWVYQYYKPFEHQFQDGLRFYRTPGGQMLAMSEVTLTNIEDRDVTLISADIAIINTAELAEEKIYGSYGLDWQVFRNTPDYYWALYPNEKKLVEDGYILRCVDAEKVGVKMGETITLHFERILPDIELDAYSAVLMISARMW